MSRDHMMLEILLWWITTSFTNNEALLGGLGGDALVATFPSSMA